VGRLAVVPSDRPSEVVGIVTRSDLLKPRARLVLDEIGRERLLGRRAPKAAEATQAPNASSAAAKSDGGIHKTIP
jgi:hypothetical protein